MAKSTKSDPKRSKKKNAKSFNFYGFNVKIRSTKRSGEDVYLSVFQQIFGRDVQIQVASERAMTLRNQFQEQLTFNGIRHQILYGKLVRYTILAGDNWYYKKKRDVEKYSAPEDVFPNAFETDYIFIPAAHRFFIKASGKVSITSSKVFLEGALNQVIEPEEDYVVSIIQSKGIIDYIITSEQLEYLKVNVTYTNDDIGDEAQELMDDLLKEGHIGEADVIFKPDQHGQLESNSKLVRGFLEIAKENGEAEAKVINEGKKEKIITRAHPEKILVKAESEDFVKLNLFNNTMKEYRPNE